MRCACPKDGSRICPWCQALAARAGVKLPSPPRASRPIQRPPYAHNDPEPTSSTRDILKVKLGFLYTCTESNTGGHWRTKAARARVQRQRTLAALVEKYGLWDPSALSDKATVVVTRIAPGTLDSHDNLMSSQKHIIDSIADWLGIDDSDPRVTWHCRQERGGRGEYAVSISIAP